MIDDLISTKRFAHKARNIIFRTLKSNFMMVLETRKPIFENDLKNKFSFNIQI